MSQFYGAGPWQTSWTSSEASSGYVTSGAHGTGWSTSWDEMMGDSARMFHKQDTGRSASAQVNGFASDAAEAPADATALDKPSTGFYEILPGQSWDAVHQPSMPAKSQFVVVNASPQQAIAKPAPVASAPIWVEVTSADGWTVPSAGLTTGQAPTTPTKMRPKSTESTSIPNSPPAFQPGSPNSALQNGKRHHDIEDELGHQDRYKTELCRSWHESGSCRYGSKCQFAHGTHELRPVMRHPKYKTEPCRSWVETRSCPYGRRCRFIHSDIHSSNNHHHHHHHQQQQQQQQHANHTSSAIQQMAANAHHLAQHPHHPNNGVNNGLNNGVHGMNPALMGTNDGIGVRHHSASAAIGQQPSGGYPAVERSMSMDGQQQQQLMMMSARHSTGGAVSSPALMTSSRGRVDPNSYMAMQSYHHNMSAAHQQSYQQQQQQYSLAAAQQQQQQQMAVNNSNMYALNSVLPGSPPYTSQGANNFGFGLSLFSGSPPLSNTSSSRENLAAARASNAPWLYDTFQDDEAEEDDDDFANDALPLTPLIEQLNLHAEPVSPTISHHHAQAGQHAPNGAQNHAHHAVSPIAPPSHLAPIGSPSSASTNNTASTEAAPVEKGKKKKGSRLHIFQRLSSK